MCHPSCCFLLGKADAAMSLSEGDESGHSCLPLHFTLFLRVGAYTWTDSHVENHSRHRQFTSLAIALALLTLTQYPAQPHPYLHTSIPRYHSSYFTCDSHPNLIPPPLLNIFHFHPVVKARVGPEHHLCDRLTQLEKGFKSS